MNSSHTKQYMLAALDEAKKAEGFCAPNPAVGAVVVRCGEIVATGYHHGPGLAHAEVEALGVLQGDLSDCMLYVTLEPCCHQGRTPPCTERIKRSGIKTVFFGLYDPNPLVAGQGQAALREAGIRCDYLQLDEVTDFYRAYCYWWQHKLPWVTVKLAIDTQHHFAIDSLTGPESQRYTQHNRMTQDALLTTLKTIVHDDPQLNARLIDAAIKKPLFVLDKHAALPCSAWVLSTCDPVTIFYHQATNERLQQLQAVGVNCISVPLVDNQLDLKYCLQKIAERGMHTLWVESGWRSASALIRQGLAQQILFYIALQNHGVAVKPFRFVYEPVNERHIEFDYLGDDLLLKVVSQCTIK